MRTSIWLFAVIATACVPLTLSTSDTQPQNLLADGIYSPTLKTVQLYPNANEATDILLPASVPINSQNLKLEFDDLAGAFQYYTAKITHCNSDWSKSSLSNLDFLTEYNSFPINSYAQSTDTHIPYVHYWFSVPRVKLGGNYVITVYLNDTEPVFSRRFMVYQSLAQVGSSRDVSGAGQLANKQPISLTVRYDQLDVMNSATQFEVHIRQNQRWDNMIQNLPATFMRDATKEIEYRITDEEWMHNGGNEYRFIDLRTIITSTGQNIARIDRSAKPYTAHVAIDKPRGYDRYSQYLDFNGGYVIQNYDNSLQYSANYVKTIFRLASKKIPGKVFLEGRLSNGPLSADAEMYYDSTRSEYRRELLLKQGWYNYQYVVRGDGKPDVIEGNHFETENMYEVFVYFKSLQPRADILVGYARMTKNPR